MSDLTQRLAVSALVLRCEAIAASGALDELKEFALRRDIAEVKAAFGFRVVGDHDPEFLQSLDAVRSAMERS